MNNVRNLLYRCSAIGPTRCTTGEEVHLRSTRAVTESNSTCESNKVSRGDVMLGNEGLLELHDFVETDVSLERSLDRVEDHDRAVSTAAAVKASSQ